MKRRQGFTLVELLVVIGIITLLIGILLPALSKARATANRVRDASQLDQIHTGWVTYAQDFQGRFPTPGVVMTDEPENPGQGDEAEEFNDTANLHSLCIMENFYSPDLVYARSEPNGNVVAKADYDWEVHSPITGIYWDESFTANLGPDADDISNVSYASLPIGGRRKTRHWKDTGDSSYAVVSNRGVVNGSLEEETYENSLTLRIHGSNRQWEGNVCYNDGSVAHERSFFPERARFTQGGENEDDNIFANDTGTPDSTDGRDIYLVIVEDESMGEDGESFSARWD